MNTETQIAPEQAEAAHVALSVKIRNGKTLYVLYGILEVESLSLARELLIDRRVTPRSAPEPTLQAERGRDVTPVCCGVLAAFPWEQ